MGSTTFVSNRNTSALEAIASGPLLPPQEQRREQRDHRDRHDVRRRQRDRQAHRERAQHRLDVAADEDDRQQHHHRRVGAGEDRQHHLFGASDDGATHVASFLVVVPLDVLEHHDRVVEQHADREDDRGQRDHVELVADEPHDRESQQVGERDRDGGQAHPAPVGQEQEDDEDRHDDRVAQGIEHVAHGLLDEVPLACRESRTRCPGTRAPVPGSTPATRESSRGRCPRGALEVDGDGGPAVA